MERVNQNKKLLIILGAILAVVAIAVGSFLLVSNNNNDNLSGTTTGVVEDSDSFIHVRGTQMDFGKALGTIIMLSGDLAEKQQEGALKVAVKTDAAAANDQVFFDTGTTVNSSALDEDGLLRVADLNSVNTTDSSLTDGYKIIIIAEDGTEKCLSLDEYLDVEYFGEELILTGTTTDMSAGITFDNTDSAQDIQVSTNLNGTLKFAASLLGIPSSIEGGTSTPLSFDQISAFKSYIQYIKVNASPDGKTAIVTINFNGDESTISLSSAGVSSWMLNGNALTTAQQTIDLSSLYTLKACK